MALTPSQISNGYTGGNILAAVPPGSIEAALEKRLAGRVASMTPDVTATILELVSNGMTIEEIHRQPGLPSKHAIHALRLLSPIFQDALDHARKVGAEAKFERSLDIVESVTLSEDGDQKHQSNQLRKAEVLSRTLIRHAESDNRDKFGQAKASAVNIQVNASSIDSIDFSEFSNR